MDSHTPPVTKENHSWLKWLMLLPSSKLRFFGLRDVWRVIQLPGLIGVWGQLSVRPRLEGTLRLRPECLYKTV